MCLLLTRNEFSKWIPSAEEQNNAWQSNPHGFGAAWLNKAGNLVFQKTMRQKEVGGIIRSIPKGSPCLLHWRMATHGIRTVENCHPFPCLGNHWVGAHNGVLSRQKCIGNLTDSESYLRELEGTEPNIEQVERDIMTLGYGKIAFLSNKGEIRIANEHEGSWRVPNEVWQSNSGLDSIPWADYSFGFSYGRDKRNPARPIVCEGCEQHVPVFRAGRDFLCESCLEVF